MKDKHITKLIWAIFIILFLGLVLLFTSCRAIAYDIQYTIEHKGEKIPNTMPYYVTVTYTNDSALLEQ